MMSKIKIDLQIHPEKRLHKNLCFFVNNLGLEAIRDYDIKIQDDIIKTVLGFKKLRTSKHVKVILSPMGFIYKAIVERIKQDGDLTVEEAQGFFKCSKVTARDSNNDILICKPDQGSAVLSVLSVLNGFENIGEIEFIGLAGGISDRMDVGQVVDVSSIHHMDQTYDWVDSPTNRIVVQMVSSMVKSPGYYDKLRSEGVDIIEMESSYVFALAVLRAINLKFHAVISDTVRENPFWTITFGDVLSERINRGVEEITKKIVREIKGAFQM